LKVKKSEAFYILGYLLESIINIWRIWVNFLKWKTLYIGRNHIFQVEIWRNEGIHV